MFKFDKNINKSFLNFACRLYLVLRNLAWISFIVISILLLMYRFLFVSLYGSLWPTPVPVPTEIHIPSQEEIDTENEKEDILTDIKKVC